MFWTGNGEFKYINTIGAQDDGYTSFEYPLRHNEKIIMDDKFGSISLAFENKEDNSFYYLCRDKNQVMSLISWLIKHYKFFVKKYKH